MNLTKDCAHLLDTVTCVEFLDSDDPSRFGTGVETVWERPRHDEGS